MVCVFACVVLFSFSRLLLIYDWIYNIGLLSVLLKRQASISVVHVLMAVIHISFIYMEKLLTSRYGTCIL